MYIVRDIKQRLRENKGIFIQIVLGPRQCGKSTLLAVLGEGTFQEVTFDDLHVRYLADRDPALFLEQYPPPASHRGSSICT